jgi:hypothetical protein
MGEKQNKEQPKRAYQKPRLRTIELLAEEVLAVGCKTQSAPGTNPGGAISCLGITCAMLGT